MSDMRFDPREMWAKMKKNSDGLVPAITQDFENNQVLMMAYMNEEAFCLTCETGYMHYYSRSRDSLWKDEGRRDQTDDRKNEEDPGRRTGRSVKGDITCAAN